MNNGWSKLVIQGVDIKIVFILLGQTRGKNVWNYLRNKRGFDLTCLLPIWSLFFILCENFMNIQ